MYNAVMGNWVIVETFNERGRKMARARCPSCNSESTQRLEVFGRVSKCRKCYLIEKSTRGGNGTARARVKRNLFHNQALKRGLEINLSDEDLDELWDSPCHYCNSAPSNISRYKRRKREEVFIYSGIDRIDNSVGYLAGNVVPCCKICNRAKGDLTPTEFIAWANKLSLTTGGR